MLHSHPAGHTYHPQHIAALYTSRYARAAVMAMAQKIDTEKRKGHAEAAATGNAPVSSVQRAGASRGVSVGGGEGVDEANERNTLECVAERAFRSDRAFAQ